MARSVHRKLKQPEAYYLSRGSTKTEMLVQFLNEVLCACHSAELHVVATVCDMGSNNVKPLRLLGGTRKNQVFKFEILIYI